MTRRIYTYAPETGWGGLNLLSTIGAVVVDLSMLLFVVDVVRTLWKGKLAGDNPWGAPTLEWSTSSPPAPYNFVSLPVVDSREPLWSKQPEGPTHVIGLSTRAREGLVTTVLDAIPDVRYVYPSPGPWPVVAAFMVGLWLIWSIFSLKATLWAMIPPAIAFIAWYWPNRRDTSDELALEKRP